MKAWQDIPLADTFTDAQYINKGMSSDKKYVVRTGKGERYLLRLADYEEFDRKKAEYELVEKMYRLDIPMPSPIDFGVCNGGASVYTLLSWIEGEEEGSRGDEEGYLSVSAGKRVGKNT